MTSGGKRKGAGRKPLPPEQRKKQMSLKFSPHVVAWIRAHPRGERTKLVEDAVVNHYRIK